MWTSAPAVVPVAITPSPDLVPPAPSKPALAIPLGGENPSAEPQGLLAGRPVGLMMDYDEDKEVASPGADSDVVARKLELGGVSMEVEPRPLALLDRAGKPPSAGDSQLVNPLTDLLRPLSLPRNSIWPWLISKRLTRRWVK